MMRLTPDVGNVAVAVGVGVVVGCSARQLRHLCRLFGSDYGGIVVGHGVENCLWALGDLDSG